ncbi:protocadherin-15 [Mytilus galloprovincialis]|uniref:Protocadherin-15 n=1 Tax=Mytilus galloprovincialis TaxID=29158 RepID=A0A8B6DKV6_MYTGA|nr:protocadherin-15 [Mytilus galloprovincialis]
MTLSVFSSIDFHVTLISTAFDLYLEKGHIFGFQTREFMYQTCKKVDFMNTSVRQQPNNVSVEHNLLSSLLKSYAKTITEMFCMFARLSSIEKNTGKNTSTLTQMNDKLTSITARVITAEKDIYDVKTRVSDLESNCQGTSNIFDEVKKKTDYLEKGFDKIKEDYLRLDTSRCRIAEDLIKVERENNDMKTKLTDIQCRAMKYNLIFTGLSEHRDENIEDKLRSFLYHEMKIDQRIEFSNVHRFGRRSENGDPFNEIEHELLMFSSDHSYICLLGDFNARTGEDLDFTEVTYDEFSGMFDLNDVSLNTLASSNINILRKSMDEKKNNFESGMTKTKGQFTCKNVSVVDYVIGSANFLTLLQNFSILETSKLFSDAHTPLSLSMCIYENEKRNHFKKEMFTPTEEVKRWDIENLDTFIENIDKTHTDIILTELESVNIEDVNHNCVNNIVKRTCDILVDAAKTTFGTYMKCDKQNNVRINTSKPWFDEDCKTARKKFKKSKRKLKHISSNPDKYTADTHINGIQNGTDSATGIFLQIQGATGSQIDVNSLFVLESKPIPTSQDGYTRRTFIRLNASLDRDGRSYEPNDDLNSIQFMLKCTRLVDSVSKYFTVNVEIIDVNDNYPQLLGSPRPISVNELTPVGVVIGEMVQLVTVMDKDTGLNGEFEFTIVQSDSSWQPISSFISNDAAEKFTILSPRRGSIAIKSPLDFERVKKYFLPVSVTDLAQVISERRTSTVTMTIDVRDGDDLGPVFDYQGCFRVDNACFNPTYTTDISHHSTASQLILRAAEDQSIIDSIKARDQDTLNARIQLSIVEMITTKPCSNGALIVGAVLGTLLAIVITIVIALIMKQRKQGDREIVTPEQRTPAHQNEGTFLPWGEVKFISYFP